LSLCLNSAKIPKRRKGPTTPNHVSMGKAGLYFEVWTVPTEVNTSITEKYGQINESNNTMGITENIMILILSLRKAANTTSIKKNIIPVVM
ncbi:MAG: hypothetical protein JSV32_05095, partial [Dehalococcoidia bacterium]